MAPAKMNTWWLNVIYAGIATIAISLSASFMNWTVTIFNVFDHYPVFAQQLINGRGGLMYLLIFTVAFNMINGWRMLSQKETDGTSIRQFTIFSAFPLLAGLLGATCHARVGLAGFRVLIESRASPLSLADVKAAYFGIVDGSSMAFEFVGLGIIGTALSLLLLCVVLKKTRTPHLDREILKTEQSVPGYPPQGVGSPEP